MIYSKRSTCLLKQLFKSYVLAATRNLEINGIGSIILIRGVRFMRAYTATLRHLCSVQSSGMLGGKLDLLYVRQEVNKPKIPNIKDDAAGLCTMSLKVELSARSINRWLAGQGRAGGLLIEQQGLLV